MCPDGDKSRGNETEEKLLIAPLIAVYVSPVPVYKVQGLGIFFFYFCIYLTFHLSIFLHFEVFFSRRRR